MSHRNPDEVSGVDGPDYVTLVIEWDALADGLESASQEAMSTKDPDWMVDQASKDSFPASDPPAWGSSHAAPSQSTAENIEGLEDLGGDVVGRIKRYRTPILLGVLGLVALTGLVAGIRFVKSR